MNFFRIILILLSFLVFSNPSLSDSHDKEQNIIDKAKEINKKVKAEQAIKSANISSETGSEEPLPLNDPFVGDGSLGGGNSIKLIALFLNLVKFNFVTLLNLDWAESNKSP